MFDAMDKRLAHDANAGAFGFDRPDAALRLLPSILIQ
jgi:hypothetical protein